MAPFGSIHGASPCVGCSGGCGVVGRQELCFAVHPDEAVAHGGAIQAAAITGEDPDTLRDKLMLDAVRPTRWSPRLPL